MALFQKSVVNKYLKQLDENKVAAAYSKFQEYFHNPSIQDNIRTANEEQFQQKFLMELFVNILGYTIFPDENHNLTTEFKNEKGAKKADGAILAEGKAIGVIELKGTDTKDLDKINAQAFSYKNNQSNCVYVVTSNFEKLRFFIRNAVDHQEFNLFNLTGDEFKMLWLCLHKESVYQGIPLKMKEESVLEEDKVTKQLYADYSIFKKELWRNMVKNHPETDALYLYKKSQKLLDRFLFVFFSEDKGLLPPNSISKIVEQWEKLKDLDEYRPLYERFKKYFGYLNNGWKGKEYEIFAYNGGLFAEDLLLDSIKIDDDVLFPHVMKLTAYDFESDVDVNILGHIFEHSLSEIENITAELEGREVEKSKTKRKKDGVYYTPKYITKYIVENTVGKLCEEMKAELGITEERFTEVSRRTRKGIKDMEDYRQWLLGLSICDPACGSGAFLNQALEFLLAEHKWLDELIAEYHSASLILSDVESQILENNLYGVDVNEESVEIAKLSLWLRTARKGRKLTTLSSHIKCGNSLIDDPEVAGEKAFDWKKEFPEVFEKDGFDVVIGNPPYVRADSPGNLLPFRKHMVSCGKYQTLKGKWDLYIPFLELSIQILNNKGISSLIIPDAYCHAEYATRSLSYFTDNKMLERFDYYPNIDVFANVGVKSVIVTYVRSKVESNFKTRTHFIDFTFSEEKFNDYPSSFRLDYSKSIISKLVDGININDVLYISVGIVGNSDEKKYKGEFTVGDLLSNAMDETHPKLYYEGKNIDKWVLNHKRWIEFGTERSPQKWRRKGFSELFTSEKIVTMRSPGKEPRTFIDREQGYFNESAIGFVRWCDLKNVTNKSLAKSFENKKQREHFEQVSSKVTLQYLLAVMNSKLIRYELNADRRSNIHVYPDDWRKIKILVILGEQQLPFIECVDTIKQHTTQLQEIQRQFIDLLLSKFDIEKLSKKLQTWYELDFKEFLKELKKAKVVLGLSEEAEWMQYFNEQKQKAQELKTKIDRVDREIDRMVYELYGLTDKEIKIIENS